NLSPAFQPYDSATDKAWSTDSGIVVQAFDRTGLGLPTKGTGETIESWASAFKTYVMYRPPGSMSKWVPLVVEDWSAQATLQATSDRDALVGGWTLAARSLV